MAIPFSLTSELLYGFLIKQVGVALTSHVHRAVVTSATMPRTPPSMSEEHEVEMLQMDRLLRWLALVFDGTDSTTDSPLPTRQAYKQELYNLYRTLCSDYRQYERWKTYNQSIWFLSSYRRYDTKTLAQKILSDVRLFREGMVLFGAMDRNEEKTDT